MRSCKTLFTLALLPVFTLSLSGCETVGQTYESTKERIAAIEWSLPSFGSSQAEETADAAGDQSCPPVTAVDELRNLSQFIDDRNPVPEDSISRVSITGVDSTCRFNENNVVVQMDIGFTGELGPRAAQWNTPDPDFVYPYFVAIAAPDGRVIAKETFALSLSYMPGQTALTQTEALRQIIPLNSDMFASDYTLMIGFQLTPDQLAYNRTVTPPPVMEPAPVVEIVEPEPAPAMDTPPAVQEVIVSPAEPEVIVAPAEPAAVIASPFNQPPVDLAPLEPSQDAVEHIVIETPAAPTSSKAVSAPVPVVPPTTTVAVTTTAPPPPPLPKPAPPAAKVEPQPAVVTIEEKTETLGAPATPETAKVEETIETVEETIEETATPETTKAAEKTTAQPAAAPPVVYTPDEPIDMTAPLEE